MAPLSRPRRWAYQAFSSLPGPARGLGETALRLRAERAVRAQPDFADAPVRLLIGPANSAGQAWQWCRAAEARLPGVSARSLGVEGRGGRSRFGYPNDILLTQPMQLRGGAAHRRRVLGATHVISEAARPVLARFVAGSLLDDLPTLQGSGVRTAVLLHGSEVRDPTAHAELYPHSPFPGLADDYRERLRAVVRRTRSCLEGFGGPVFVSTPDLLDFAPGATWLPLVVDVHALDSDAPVLERERPVVLHAPSNPRLKGTSAIEAGLADLESTGRIRYQRLERVPHEEMAARIAAADVVVDQVVLGNPGVLMAESLAAGRVVLAHLSEEVRLRMAQADQDGQPPPVVEADPGSLGEVLDRVLRERAAYRDLASQGPAWARRNHDGARAASALAPFLGVGQP